MSSSVRSRIQTIYISYQLAGCVHIVGTVPLPRVHIPFRSVVDDEHPGLDRPVGRFKDGTAQSETALIGILGVLKIFSRFGMHIPKNASL